MDISAYHHMNIRMSTRGKRPLRNLTPSDKVRAIQRIHNGETKASVSRDIGVPESTLRGWCKNEQKLKFMCRQLGSADELQPMSSVDIPREKRPRFDNHIQTPKYPVTSSRDEFGYKRFTLNDFNFPSNGSNSILDKIALNEIMKKYMPLADNVKQPMDMSTKMRVMNEEPISIKGDYNHQLFIMQNFYLLSLLSPNLLAISSPGANEESSLGILKEESRVVTKSSCNNSICSINNNSQNNSISNTPLVNVNNWAKDTVENSFLNLRNQSNSSILTPPATINHNEIIRHVNDSINNSVKDKISSLSIDVTSDDLNFPLPLSLGLLQLPNIHNILGSEGGHNIALLEWCKVFNASLNFLALAAAAATLQPNDTISAARTNNNKKEKKNLYKELKNSANLIDSAYNPTSFISSDASNDSYFDSEPEDLSVRSNTTSKLSSPANSRSESPVKSIGSCPSLQSDGEN